MLLSAVRDVKYSWLAPLGGRKRQSLAAVQEKCLHVERMADMARVCFDAADSKAEEEEKIQLVQ